MMDTADLNLDDEYLNMIVAYLLFEIKLLFMTFI